MASITVKAEARELNTVLSFVTGFLEENGVSFKATTQLEIAAEEVFVNIYSYAYQNGEGEARISIKLESGSIYLSFADRGIAYNPLEHEDPDTSLGVDERKIGGLGIFMIKKSMDDVKYDYLNGENVLTLIKSI